MTTTFEQAVARVEKRLATKATKDRVTLALAPEAKRRRYQRAKELANQVGK